MKIGITTTVPVEVIYAAGHTPVDINNIFITESNPGKLVEEAELAGYPRNVCAWIKGLYSTVLSSTDIKTVIAVTQGDCSNTHALMETLQLAGVKIIPFAFPFDRDTDLLRLQIEKLMEQLGTNFNEVSKIKDMLDQIRKSVWLIDELTWRENLVTGLENHLVQVNCSDFKGDPQRFAEEINSFTIKAKQRDPLPQSIRIGYIGVPPIMSDLYDYLEERGGRVVFNETQRQFTMPFETGDIVEQYRLYTYPYGIFYRLKDILKEIERRKIDGIIHYAQSFCYRQIEDLIIRQKIKIPILTIEGDKPNKLDARTKMRIESFLDMLR